MIPTDLLAHNAEVDDAADGLVLIVVIVAGIVGIIATWFN